MQNPYIPFIRIFAHPQKGRAEEIHYYQSACVPRIGDLIGIQYWFAKVYRVEWTIINGKAHADVYCDSSEAEKRFRE